MKNRYAIGIDFGTLSARAVLIDIDHGVEVMSSVYGYQDAVIDEYLLNPKLNFCQIMHCKILWIIRMQ